jgi:S-adenosylmethionine decarboxylase proenzyme
MENLPNISSGKHMICELKNIQNHLTLNSLSEIRTILDIICHTYDFNVLGRMEHSFTPIGHTLIYLLSESHISVHTFPEKQYIAMDIYTCREYEDNSVYQEIYDYLVGIFEADREKPIIIDRGVGAGLCPAP